jgi:4-amino-4-deoxy-L-arabinose transferase-like glycosyltransferase
MNKHPLAIVSLCCILLWLLFGALTPVVQDEAYYFLWSHFPGAGFFDHPPGVAFMAFGHRIFPGSVLGGRTGTIIVGTLTLLAAIRMFRVYGLNDRKTLVTALVFSQFNLLGLIGGFLTTPDTALILFWVLAVTESMLALNGQKWRWLTAGLFTGLGLWSKYTMLAVGLVFLWGLIAETHRGRAARGLKSPWPYLGGVVALLVFLPHLTWNAQHDWITFKFQLRHGFAMERPEFAAVHLPAPEPFDPESAEAAMATSFAAIQELQEQEEMKPKPWDQALKKLNIYLGFYGSQIALWGLLIFPMTAAWWRRRQAGADARAALSPSLSAGSRQIVVASVAVPLFVFGIISLFSKVEANWSAMYIVGASALAARYLTPYVRRAGMFAAINALIVGAVVAHAKTGFLPLREHRDRIMAETHGYEKLADLTGRLNGLIFSDSYQIASMLRFYQPQLKVRQWPGITRDSEFLRQAELSDLDYDQVRAAGNFWLVTTDLVPPRIPGFRPDTQTQLRDCKGSPLQVITRDLAEDPEVRCKSLIHEWYLIRYQVTPDSGKTE